MYSRIGVLSSFRARTNDNDFFVNLGITRVISHSLHIHFTFALTGQSEAIVYVRIRLLPVFRTLLYTYLCLLTIVLLLHLVYLVFPSISTLFLRFLRCRLNDFRDKSKTSIEFLINRIGRVINRCSSSDVFIR